MKRLKNKLLSMKENTSTYTDMYQGSMVVHDEGAITTTEYDPTYYDENIGFVITETHKLAKDKPTVTINIPCDKIGVTVYGSAVADTCLSMFKSYIDELNDEIYNRSRPDNENGKYYIYEPSAEIVKRNSVYFAMCPQRNYSYGAGSAVYVLPNMPKELVKMCLCIKIQVQLPLKKIKKAMKMLCNDLPNAVKRYVDNFSLAGLQNIVELTDKQAKIRAWLRNSEYCAFIANGSILPRLKNSDKPMLDAISFKSTPEDEIEICGVRGMGIKKGVTVITGGGYSGKSTLIDAVSAGIYDHVLGDGRELCITDESAVVISAEDGRKINNVNISPFIKLLPNGDTDNFSTDRASGSTSQAANIMEAIDGGARLLLIDEDRSATNFMIRDRLMRELIKKEPITPFTDRVQELYKQCGVSTILVIGGSGEYLSIADNVYLMEDYLIHNVTAQCKKISSNRENLDLPQLANWQQTRKLHSEGFTSYPDGCGSERLEVSDMGIIMIGNECIDVRGLHNIVSKGQLNAIGFMLRQLEISNCNEIIDIKDKLDKLYDKIDKDGLDFVYSSYFTTCERFLDLPRKQEVLAVINRMRHVRCVE